MMGAPLLRMPLKVEERDSILATIETSAHRGAALVRQLLIFGRGVEGERRPVAPHDIIAEVVKIARETFPRNITITEEVAPEVARVHGDATQLHQVLLNLCVNARDAMPQGGVLHVSAESILIDDAAALLQGGIKPGRYVLLRVADTGVGIPPEIADQIFDPFFTTKEIGKGTGLGLSTVLGIVKSHAGLVRLDSEPGRGTTFEILLPASREPVGKLPQPVVPLTALGRGELILVVDDEQSIRTVLRDTLARHNYKVLTAEDGVEATAVFAANPGIKLIVTDLDMPLMSGVRLGHILRRLNPAVKIIVSTGLAERIGAEKRQQEMEALGITAVLIKPYTGERILRTVHAAFTDAPIPMPEDAG
jgi:two-component system, cell cycle sensor histidine kinase and response regulator CckA